MFDELMDTVRGQEVLLYLINLIDYNLCELSVPASVIRKETGMSEEEMQALYSMVDYPNLKEEDYGKNTIN